MQRMSHEVSNDAPLRVFRPTRWMLFYFVHLLFTAVGLLCVGLALYSAWRGLGGNLHEALFEGGWVMVLGLVFLAVGLPALVRCRRVFTAVYADHVVVSNAWRTRTIARADLREASRGIDDGEWIVYLGIANRFSMCPLAVQYARRAEQEEFMALVNGLVAERQTN